MSAFIDITGKRFGRLIAIKIVGKYIKGKNTSIIWECVCDCGNTVKVTKNVLGFDTNSCGCLRKDLSRNRGLSNKGKRMLPEGVAAKNKLFDRYKRAAESRNLEFILSLNEFETLTKKNCHYCGIHPNQKAGDRRMNGEYIYNGIDRVDNSIGYTAKNCVPCCGHCNQAKMDMSVKEFKAWIDRVYNHQHPNIISANFSYNSNQVWGDGTAEGYRNSIKAGTL